MICRIIGIAGLAWASAFAQEHPAIPKAWAPRALAESTVSPLGLKGAIEYAPADWYYRIPERRIYKTYPVYRPDREPENYIAFLSAQKPEIVFDTAAIRTDFDWLEAGEAVFSSAGDTSLLTPDDLRDPDVWKRFKLQIDGQGALAGWRYVIRQRGKVELAPALCGGCHEGAVNGIMVAGAPGTWLMGAMYASNLRRRLNAAPKREPLAEREVARQFALFSVPWLSPDPALPISQMGPSGLWRIYDAVVPGAAVRTGTNPMFPPRIPDLIGVKDRNLFGATGWYRHRSLGDLMGYIALETGFDDYTKYGDFRPSGPLPDPASLERLSDAQAYAVARYLYGLQPPKNPNRLDKLGKLGQKIFDRERCGSCHPAPAYTTGKTLPPDGSDPRLAVETRKGTGGYRVPSLKNVWYREPLGHDGSVTALEDWFDGTRLRDDYAPRPVKGHLYGLKLPFEERSALTAFLRTL